MREGRVAKYRDGYAVIIYDDEGKRHRYKLNAGNKREAQASANRIIAARAATNQARPAHTVREIVEMYLEQTEAIGRDTMRHHAKPVVAAVGGEMAAHAGTAARAYAAARRGSVKPGTIRKELGLLRAVLRWAERHQHIDSAPHITLPPAPPPRERRLTREEIEALTNQCKQPHLLLFVLIARYTAARAGAILSLRWDQVDFEKRRIDLGGSGRQKRRAVVPLHPSLALALVIAKEAALSPYVIEYGGRRVGSIKKGFKAACKNAGLEDVSPHVLRHTAASWMAEAGVPMVEIAQFLGHTNPSVTYRTYARFSPDYLGKALGALS